MGRASFLTKVVRWMPRGVARGRSVAGRGGRAAGAVLGLALVAACGGGEAAAPPEGALTPASLDGLAPAESGGPAGATSPYRTGERTPPSLAPDAPKVVVLGDSLSAGLHLPADEAWPAVAAGLLAAEGLPIELVNAGVSGDTTAGGLARRDWLRRLAPDLMGLELGANDGLRGVALDSVEANLRAILERLEAEQVEVLLLGMKLPSNYGEQYASGFEQLFARLAEDTGVAFVPFFLDGVALDPELNLADGLHPNTAGHRILAANLLPALRPLVRALAPEPES
ncbi:MAG: arylesterase [Planctomycetota bacterium]|nr:arylesterase [Planctomycetota bacterium]